MNHLVSAIGKTWTNQEEAIRATAKYLGFRRAGAINGALRTGLLERGPDGRLRAM